MKSTSELFKTRKCIQIIVDRFYRSGGPPEPIKGRILKDWKDRMPNWQPDSNGDYPNDYYYGGNLRGIEEKLPYIKAMGFDMIYLSPLDKSLEYHHYDVGDQSEIDPWFGTWDDLESLCIAAEKLGIVVIVDVVFNHTSCKSIYVKTHPEWYKKDAKGNPEIWANFEHLYEIDSTNKSYITEMKKILRKYIEKGVKGFRFDLGMKLSREFLLEMATLKNEFPYIIFILEMWEIATTRGDPKIFDGQADSVMNYPMTDAILRWCAFGNAEHFKYNFGRVYSEYPKIVQNLLLNNIATHDTPLTMTMLANIQLRQNQPIMNPDVFDGCIWDIEKPWRSDNRPFDTYGFRLFEAEHDRLTQMQYELAFKLSRVAFALMYSIGGIPCVMQGTDIGDTGFKDPFCRKPYDWFNPDLSMQAYITSLNKIYDDNIDVFAEGDSNLATCDDNIIILERFDYRGHRTVTAVSNSYKPMPIWIKNDCPNLKVIYSTDNSTKQCLAPYGVLFAREN